MIAWKPYYTFIAIGLLPAILTGVAMYAHYSKKLNQAQQQIALLEQAKTQAETVASAALAKQAAAMAAMADNPPTTPLQELYGTDNSALDRIKHRYEEILVTHFFLRKCDMATALDFHVINSALSQEMASVNAPGRLQYDIVTAAQGSYKEIYSKSSCEGKSTENLREQYTTYINAISKLVATPP